MFRKTVFAVLICAASTLPNAQAGSPMHILTLGDSNGSFPYSWPRQLQLALPHATVFNISKSGRTIGFVNNGDSSLNSLHVLEANLKQAVTFAKGVPYSYIVLELGTNDGKAVFANRQNEVAANLKRLIDGIRTYENTIISKAKIIIITPPPYGSKAEATEKYKGGSMRVKDMNAAFISLAKQEKCLVVSGYETIGNDIETLTNDGLHLNADASVKLIEPVVSLIQKQNLPVVARNEKVKLKMVQVKAPFKMPAISMPDFSACSQFNITQFGAEKGNKEKTTQAIATAISKANAAGGGTVVIPAGEWLTGKVHLKSNVNLHLAKGAVLLFSEDPNDYLPAVHSTWEGMECMNYSPLIYAYQCKNVAITGEGEVKSKLDVWKGWYTRPPAHMASIKRLYNLAWNYAPLSERDMTDDSSHLRPQFIQFNRCENVLMEGIKITNSPFWTIHLYLAKNVVLRKLNVYAHGHNNDGVDPEMSENVLIEHCVFDQGDDAIAIKSGRNPEGWRLKTPSKNIVIRNNTVKNGHQLVAVGSELSGGIENVFIDSCEVVDGAKLFHLLFIKTNERMGGYVKNIHATNIKAGKIDLGVLGIETDVLYQWKNLVPTYEKRLTPIQDVYLTNVQAGDVRFVSRIIGQPELPVRHVVLKQIRTGTIADKKEIHTNVIEFSEQ